MALYPPQQLLQFNCLGNSVLSSFFKINSTQRTGKTSRVVKSGSTRMIIGYGLLVASILISITTFITSQYRPKFHAYQTTSAAGSNTSLSQSQIRLVSLSTSDSRLVRQFANKSQIRHMVTAHSLQKGQLIQTSDLMPPGRNSKSGMEMVVPLKSGQAPLADIIPGSYLRIIATIGTGQSATSMVVARGVKVLQVLQNSQGVSISSQNSSDILVSVSNPIESIALAQAEATGTLTAILVPSPNASDFAGTYSLGEQPAPTGTSTKTPA